MKSHVNPSQGKTRLLCSLDKPSRVAKNNDLLAILGKLEMADRLVIERLEVEGFVGIDESERSNAQPLAVDLELSLDLSKAIPTDNLQNTVDYATVAKKIVATAKQEQFCLIETLAERLAEVILEGPTIKEVRLWVRKLRPPLKISVGSVGARIARGCRIGQPSQNESAASWLVDHRHLL